MEVHHKLFSSKFFGQYGNINETQVDSLFKLTPEDFIISKEKENELVQYYNRLQYCKLMTRYGLSTSKTILRKPPNLIELLKKEYHLK